MLGLNIEAAMRRALSSFAPDKTRIASFRSDEIAFGRQENDADDQVVFSNLGIRCGCLIVSLPYFVTDGGGTSGRTLCQSILKSLNTRCAL